MYVRAGGVALPHHRLDGVDDGDGLVLRAGAGDQLDGCAVFAVRGESLVRLEARLVVADQAVGGGQDVADGAEVLLDPQARRRAGRGAGRVVRRRTGEARVELGEGGEAGAPEAVDRLVVVADDHDVVRPVRRAAEQLDQLDLGDVGVLELVDQQVAVQALVAAQDVGARLEQLGDGGDLLAEVQRAAAGELLLVGVVDGGELVEAHDLERGAVDDVGGSQRVDPGLVDLREPVPAPPRRRCRRECGGPRGRRSSPWRRRRRWGFRRGLARARSCAPTRRCRGLV